MRKTILLVVSIVFATSVLAISLINQSRQQLIPIQETANQPLSIAEVESLVDLSLASDSAHAIGYYLPYPGLLPDNPLYWIKMIRDRIRLIITSNPLEKSKLLLLYADKRLGAAQALAIGNKFSLVETTTTKAEKYLYQSMLELTSLGQDQSVNQAWQKLYLASLKHQQIITQIISLSPDSLRPMFDQSLIVAQMVEQKTEEIVGTSEKIPLAEPIEEN